MKDLVIKKLIPRAALTTAMLCAAALVAGHEGEHASGAGDANITIQSVLPGGPAAAAGFEEGDGIIRFGGQEIKSHEDMQKVMAAHLPGDTVAVTVKRKEEAVDLALTFGERQGGGVSMGVSLAIMSVSALPLGEGLTREECLAWVDETYRLDAMMRILGLELVDDAKSLRACLENDVQGMPSPMPTGWCDNSFKIHCSGLDLLTEIGEAQVEQCGKLLGEPLDACAAQEVFDRYSKDGEASDEAACRAAQDACSGSG